MVNAEEIFKISMALCDSLDEEGRADSGENAEYRSRALPLINSLIPELLPYSQSYLSSGDMSPGLTELKSFSDCPALDSGIARSVLPLGLAAALLLSEDPESSERLRGRYSEAKAGLRRGFRAVSEDIEDVYGGLGHGGFGRW